ncbi:MAG: hypothetical protein SOX56_09690 [[Pasteurella] mairii]|uniref:Uncharacterized protein n=1 Tax=[Pasteurella] mairii TaxID=757 RepID=A0A379B7E2_9PAST|nr:hypothetical protein [[Pasteurella] mairii]SUB34446.1 Uncharacterised protein [[Pasteurella] mairii]
MKMTRFAKFVDKTENAINKFKHWQASKWLKAIIILGIFTLFFSLFYVIYHLFELILCFALWVAFQYLPKEAQQFILNLLPTNNEKDTSDGYRNGHSGFGFYRGDVIRREQ